MLQVVEPGDDEILPPDTHVGDYRIRALVDEGAMGRVYLAQDMTLGRRVALKLIKHHSANPADVQRFLDEARATASFSHPHVVTLHGVGEFRGRPYFALEYLDGESLRHRITRERIPELEAIRILRSVAEAISDAHRRGLVHADLKPENVVIPRDGRTRVVDFGLAKLIGTDARAASGTPAYMAPERWRDQPPTVAIDVWALGVMLYELFDGTRPFSDADLMSLGYAKQLPELPQKHAATRWFAVVRDCLAIEPAARPSAEIVVRRLTQLLDQDPTTDDTRCPFPGLSAFTSDDSENYFGRESELDAVVELIRDQSLIPIIGASGIGKSSFVYAALLPRLDESGRWNRVTMRPGSNPYASLVAALGLPRDQAAVLAAHPQRLSLLLAEHARKSDTKTLLFVDQFEEVFTLAGDDALGFCECLAGSAADDEPWRIVLTIRDDFVGRLTESKAMRSHFGAVVSLTAMSTSELRDAIVRPLGGVGFTLDDAALANRIVSEVETQPACLPLLQFVCRALWERRDEHGKRLLAREYDAMGGATGALSTHAQRVLAQLTPDQVQTARTLLLKLVNPDGTRRPRLRAELVDGVADAPVVLDRLLDFRLLVASRDLDGTDSRIELAHEALATTWPQLVRWLDESYEQRVLVSDLDQAAELWERRGRRSEETWTGGALGEAVRKLDQWGVTLPSRSREFIRAAELRESAGRRRKRLITIVTIATLSAAAVVAVVAALAFKSKEQDAIAANEQIRLAAADMGRFELHLVPYDWTDHPVNVVGPLTWKLFAYDPRDPFAIGKELTQVVRGTPSWRNGELVETVEARAGAAIMQVERGDCPPSTIFMRRLPGFEERATPSTVRLRIPTCGASNANTITIPAGQFFSNVPDANHPEQLDAGVDALASLLTFAIDRTEVTRATFDIYGSMEAITGESAAPNTFFGDGDVTRLPVTGVNFVTARHFCRYLGKDLPSVVQWQKAFRGGLDANPDPRRLLPWIKATSAHPANLADAGSKLAPPGSFVDDTSPYGVVDLAGNVSEWTRDVNDIGRYRGLRIVLGSNVDTSPESGDHKVSFRNSRIDGYLDLVIGMRCVSQ